MTKILKALIIVNFIFIIVNSSSTVEFTTSAVDLSDIRTLMISEPQTATERLLSLGDTARVAEILHENLDISPQVWMHIPQEEPTSCDLYEKLEQLHRRSLTIWNLLPAEEPSADLVRDELTAANFRWLIKNRFKYGGCAGISVLTDEVCKGILTANNLPALIEALIGKMDCHCLDLYKLQTSTLPDNIGLLPQVRYLDCSKCGLTRLPESITNLTTLKSLDLDGSCIMNIRIITAFTQLTTLSLGEIMGDDLSFLELLTELEYLTFAGSRLPHFPTDLLSLPIKGFTILSPCFREPLEATFLDSIRSAFTQESGILKTKVLVAKSFASKTSEPAVSALGKELLTPLREIVRRAIESGELDYDFGLGIIVEGIFLG